MKAALNNQTEYNISLLELIFSIRNKEYGAYVLRTTYNRNLTIALLITVLIFGISLILPQLLKKDSDAKIIHKPWTTAVEFFPTTDIEQNKINIPIEQTKKMDVSKIKFVVPKVVDNLNDQNQSTVPTIDEMEGKVISVENRNGTVADNIPPDENINMVGPVIETRIEETNVFSYVEEMPSYPGGTDELLNLISKNIVYPEIARRAGVEGKVLLGFVVERDGSITGINVMKGIGAGCDEEAIRVLKLVGNWLPGKQNGKAVRVSMVIPFVFKLSA